MPVARRGVAARSTVASGRGARSPSPSTQRRRGAVGAPPAAPRGPRATAAVATGASAGASVSVFHAWHEGHWPNQRGSSLPHCVQKNERGGAFLPALRGRRPVAIRTPRP